MVPYTAVDDGEHEPPHPHVPFEGSALRVRLICSGGSDTKYGNSCIGTRGLPFGVAVVAGRSAALRVYRGQSYGPGCRSAAALIFLVSGAPAAI